MRLIQGLVISLQRKYATKSKESKNLNRLRVIIAEKNVTNKCLSEQLGIGQATISKWVTNTSHPNLEMLVKLSKVLDVDMKDLVRYDDVVVERKEETKKSKE